MRVAVHRFNSIKDRIDSARRSLRSNALRTGTGDCPRIASWIARTYCISHRPNRQVLGHLLILKLHSRSSYDVEASRADVTATAMPATLFAASSNAPRRDHDVKGTVLIPDRFHRLLRGLVALLKGHTLESLCPGRRVREHPQGAGSDAHAFLNSSRHAPSYSTSTMMSTCGRYSIHIVTDRPAPCHPAAQSNLHEAKALSTS